MQAVEPSESFGTVLSVFSGAGGLDLGLEAAGFTTVGCIEKDPKCAMTLKFNRPAWQLLTPNDVMAAANTLKPSDLSLCAGDLSIVAAGPPCQPFSVAGQWTSKGRRGMNDGRSATVGALLNIVESFLPEVLLIENVAGFLRGVASAKPFVDARLEEINQRYSTKYDLTARVMDSADYGVPQHRRRVVAVALRDGGKLQYPSATHLSNPVTAWEAIGDLKETNLPVPHGRWTDLLPSIPEGLNYQYLTYRGGGQELFGYRTRYWSFLLKLAKDRPAWTLPASPGPASGPFHWDNRPLTVRERMRLQSFPDSWSLAGSPGDQIRQVGNATPPLLSEVIGRELVSQIFKPRHSWNSGPGMIRPGLSPAPPPCPAVPVPASYTPHLGNKGAHPGPGQGPAPRKTDETTHLLA